jgi:O-antigen/teichoic acid export membrane protein
VTVQGATEAGQVHAGAGGPGATRVRRRIVRGSIWVFSGRIAASACGLFVAASLARILHHQVLGTYFLILNIVTIGSTIGEMGLDRTVVRYVAASLATDDPGRARRTVRNVLILGTFGSLVSSSVLVLGLGSVLGSHIFHSPVAPSLLVLAAAWLVATALQGLLAETLRGFQRFGLATVFGGLLVNAFSMVVFGGAWLLDVHPALALVVATSLALTSMGAVLAALFVARRTRRLGPLGDAPAGEIFQVSWPLLITNLSSFAVGTGIDLWVVGIYANRSDVAVYGAASRLSVLLAMPFLMVAQVVPPIIAELHAKGRKHQLERALRSVSTVASIPAIAVMALFVVAGGWVMGTIYGPYFSRGSLVLVVLSASTLVLVATGSSGNALMMTGNQRIMMRITIFSAALSVSMELVLVHPFGMVGVASATCVAQVVQNLLQLLVARRRLGIWTQATLSLRPVRTALRMMVRR